MKPEGIECVDWLLKEPGSRVCRLYLPGGTCEHPTRLLCEEWQRRGEPSYDVEAFAIVGKSQIPTKPATPQRDRAGERLLDLPAPGTSSAPHAAPGKPTNTAPGKSTNASTPHSALRIPTAADLLQPPPAKDRDEVPRSPEDFALKPSGTIKATTSPAERARASYASKQTGATVEVVKPYETAKRIEPEQLAALAATFPEVVLDSAEVGQVALVAVPTGRDDRVELTYGDAATLRLLVDAFPGARVTGLKSRFEARGASGKIVQEAAKTNTPLPEAVAPSDAAEPEVDPFALDTPDEGTVDPFALNDDQVPF